MPGDSLWSIAPRVYGNGVMWTQLDAPSADWIANPNLFYDSKTPRFA